MISTCMPSSISVHQDTILDKSLIFCIYSIFLLLPWYYNASGRIQPVDIPVMIASLFFLLRQKKFLLARPYCTRQYIILLILLSFIMLRYMWTYFSAQNSHALHDVFASFYYVVLITVFVTMLFYLYQSRSERCFYIIVLNCLLINVLLPLLTMIFWGWDYGQNVLPAGDANTGRAMLTFNNANQLGFFALINLSLFFYLTLFAKANRLKVKKVSSIILININLIFILISASRAAMPGILIYFISYSLIFNLKEWHSHHPRLFYISFFLGMIAVVFLVKLGSSMIAARYHALPHSEVPFLTDIYIRSIDGISYNFKNINILLFGNGSLFNPWRVFKLEFHNNFVSIFNQIGIFGLLLYSYMIIDILLALLKKGILFILPFICYLFYSDVHYAFRTRMNWLFFAMILFLLVYHKLKTKV